VDDELYGGWFSVETAQDPFDPPNLLALADSLRVLTERLREEVQIGADDVLIHERTLRFVLEQARLGLNQGVADPMVHLRSALHHADLFNMNVLPSGKRGIAGSLFTGSKKAFVSSLRPFHVEMLRPQRNFDLALCQVLGHVIGNAPAVVPDYLSLWAKETLTPLVDNTGWKLQSHRSALVSAPVRIAKRQWLARIRHVVEPILQRQRKWNELAIHAVERAAQWPRVSAAEAHHLVGQLSRINAPPAETEVSGLLKLSLPLWRDVFRRQHYFNIELERTLSNFFGFPRQPEDGRSAAYLSWLVDQEPAQIERANERLGSVKVQPLLSLITPTYETPEPLLRACIDSVLAQSYPHWELCLVDDGSKKSSVRDVLREYAARDPRIRVKALRTNGGIARATNQALAMAKGDFVCFLDHDDEIRPHALAEMVNRISERPDVDVLYSDEDRLDMQGRRQLPFFKPDWSPELLRACNYVCHFLVVRRRLMEEVGGIRTGYDGAQDYDLILRLSEKTHRIEHIPQILYHWRATPQSTAQNPDNKPTASNAGVRALREHLERLGEDAEVHDPVPTSYRVRYPVEGQPLVSVVIRRKLEVVVVGPKRALPATLSTGRLLEWDRPEGVPQMLTWAAQQTRGEMLLFMHDDLEHTELAGWLEELVSNAQRPSVGLVGPKLVHLDGTLQATGLVLGPDKSLSNPFAHMADQWLWTPLGSPNWTRNYLAVSDACFMVARQKFEGAGGFGAEQGVMQAQLGLSLRLAEQGLRTIYTPHARLVHHDLHAEKETELRPGLEWQGRDPFFNPNLSVANGRFWREARRSTKSVDRA
jgi:GT2 family glycosyltransferase